MVLRFVQKHKNNKEFFSYFEPLFNPADPFGESRLPGEQILRYNKCSFRIHLSCRCN